MRQAEYSRLGRAFAISLAFHLLVWGGYQGARKAVHWIEVNHPAWLKPVEALPEWLAPKPPKPQAPLAEPPLLFVDVNPTIATPEPPKNARFESDKNSVAANPEADKEANVPKIAGQQTDVLKTEDVARQPEQVRQLQPMIPAQPAAEDQPEVKAKRTFTPGDLHVGKPDPTPKLDVGDAPQPRPRTLKEAMARQPQKLIPGAAMKQEGGVKRRLEISALDVKATLFGAYEATIVGAISQRWFNLLDDRAYAADNRGKVVIRFSLHYDGTITGVKVAENTTGAEVLGYVCVKAVQDPAPYAPWPSDMRHEIASGVFEVQFTFFYN
jgi:TonB family protein